MRCRVELLIVAIALATCHASAEAVLKDSVYTVKTAGQTAVVRVLTSSATCPTVLWDLKTSQIMSVRAAASVAPTHVQPAAVRHALFDVLTCEAAWPDGVRSAQINGQEVPAPAAETKRIVIVADTGCRMKAAEQAFQECNNPKQWPFAQVAQSAAAMKPDLVIHIGDIHYRESPCPKDNAGCQDSPWGYGYDAWRADFFEPARPLLAAAPWVFVRGNHESCNRAGQGWFRFIDGQPWEQERSCDDPAQDGRADYSSPYAVPIAADTQIIVFDSSSAVNKTLHEHDESFDKYAGQLKQVAQLARDKSNNFFLSHHPLLAFLTNKHSHEVFPAGNKGLLSVFGSQYPQTLFPPGITLAMHGHVHLFEYLGFSSAHPPTLILGNSGSAMDGHAPTRLPADAQAYPGARVKDYSVSSEYGFATIEQGQGQSGPAWRFTEYTVDGQPTFTCILSAIDKGCRYVGKNNSQ